MAIKWELVRINKKRVLNQKIEKETFLKVRKV